MTDGSAVANEIRSRGEDDWMMAAEVAWVAKSVGGAETLSEVRDVSTEVLGDVLRAGEMRIGTVTEEGFQPWEGTVEEWLQRVERQWDALGRLPEMGELFWLARIVDGTASADVRPGEQ